MGVDPGAEIQPPIAGRQPLRFTSFLGANALDFYRAVVSYLAETTGLPAVMVAAAGEQNALFEQGEVDGGFSCGLPYVRQTEAPQPAVRLLAAPVMAGPRYAGRPVYFSDLIVRRDSAFQRLAELRGARFAYNQPTSFSGYVHPRYHMHTLNESFAFFGAMLQSGSHATSMDWVESGQADCAAIDSVVLAMELAQHPERQHSFRVIESIGPAPMPPLIASARLPEAQHARLTDALLQMHTQPRGRSILQAAGMDRFAAVSDQDYDPIRHMLHALAAEPSAP